MNTGVICDGISRDLEHALTVMDEFGLEYAELQFVWGKEIGDHSPGETAKIKETLKRYQKPVSCLSRHLFAGMTVRNRPFDPLHRRHMDYLKRVIDLAHDLRSPLVRILGPKKEAIVWGKNGAEVWNVAHGAWDGLLNLMYPAIEIARTEEITLVVETGNGTMVNSAYSARRMIDDLNAKDVLKVLWDPANSLWCHEHPFPDAYEELRDGYLAHIHVKDVEVDTPRSTLKVCEFPKGQIGRQYFQIADSLRNDSYDGVISYESVYHPGDGSFEAGFRHSIQAFLDVFGEGK